jgi:hypothetical protein
MPPMLGYYLSGIIINVNVFVGEPGQQKIRLPALKIMLLAKIGGNNTILAIHLLSNDYHIIRQLHVIHVKPPR